ncbi:hypothetical protein ACHAXR_002047 [Thalassiosira sp. AJA248-18]
MAKSKKKQHGNKKSSKKEQQKQLRNIIGQANGQTDPLNSIPNTFCDDDNVNKNANNDNNSKQNNHVATIRHFASASLPPNILHQCLELFKTNMGDMYRESKWGLDVDEKLKELQHHDARFLVVVLSSTLTDNDSVTQHATATSIMSTMRTEESNNEVADDTTKSESVLGFAHFRYEPDDDDHPKLPITYLYELQINPSYQRKHGLGKRLMTIVELLSLKLQMKKVMLTVFHSNEAAMGFYTKRMRYAVDECSPSNFEGEENEGCDYEILSKALGGA